jgi:hypothetical protein
MTEVAMMKHRSPANGRSAARLRRKAVGGLIAVAALAAVVALQTAPAQARESSSLGALAVPCTTGTSDCLDSNIAELRARFGPLGQECQHHAVFGLTAWRTEQTFKWAADQPGFFDDLAWVRGVEARQVHAYATAYDNWLAGNRAAVPQAWLIAFDRAQARGLTGVGNLLVGLNAWVNRDLPFSLEASGLVSRGGQSHKPDHDKWNEMFNFVVEPLVAELAARFDPAISNLQTPYGVGYNGLLLLIQTWREVAWRNAELLDAASDPAARALVAQTIETTAATEATALQVANSYLPPVVTSRQRDAFCATHNGDQPPMAYTFGNAPPY